MSDLMILENGVVAGMLNQEQELIFEVAGDYFGDVSIVKGCSEVVNFVALVTINN
jgi:hypothetical protein